MVGGHYHWWRPWSPYFTVVGPWFYWYGAYDPFFWSYWPYYSYYYRSYYPSYYAGGRYFRNGYRVAPPNHARSSDRLAWHAARRRARQRLARNATGRRCACGRWMAGNAARLASVAVAFR